MMVVQADHQQVDTGGSTRNHAPVPLGIRRVGDHALCGNFPSARLDRHAVEIACAGGGGDGWNPTAARVATRCDRPAASRTAEIIANASRGSTRRRRLPADSGERSTTELPTNVLDRQFDAPAPNRKWAADFTYVWTAQGWLYVAVVLDLYSRRIVGWSMSATMTAELVTDALVMAIWRRGRPRDLLHHSDRGSQYTSEQCQRLMAEHGVTCSLSRSGNVWDNAAMESFFSTLKTERTANKVYRSRDQARADIFDYIERFYNPRRRHSTLGYVSPVDFEKQMRLA